MNKIYIVATLLFGIINRAQAQLTVTAFANNPTICAGNSTTLNASATPVSYTVSSVSTNLSFNPGLDILADAGVAITPISSGSTLDDCRWDNITLPFNFRFFGTSYSSISVCSNGWIALGSTPGTNTGMGFTLPNATAPNNVIHGVTADLDLRGASGGTLEYFTEGGSPNRVFVVSYTNVLFRTGGGTATFQIKLYETSNIVEVHTSAADNTTLAKAQGVENAAGTAAYTVTGRNNTTNWSGTGFTNSYRFTPDVINFSWSPSAGLSSTTGAVVTASPANTTIYTVTGTNASSGATGNTTVTVTIDAASNVLAGTPVAGGAAICQNKSISGSTAYRDANCNLIATILPSGASPVSNVVNTCLKVDTGATKKGTSDLYAARHYDITPQVNASTATATVTLYFLQAEFNKFNLRALDSGHTALPTGPADATGISNLIVRQFHGTGTLPGNYSPGTISNFDNTTAGVTIGWNSTHNWWEITIPVNGFSGFYLTSKKAVPVPVTLEYFKGSRLANAHLLNWKVNCTSTEVTFTLERSGNGTNFTGIATFKAPQAHCLQAFEEADNNPLNGANYYRLKIIDIDGKVSYSPVVLLLNKQTGFAITAIAPTVVNNGRANVLVTAAAAMQADFVITDMEGRILLRSRNALSSGSNTVQLNVQQLAAGIYRVTGYSNEGQSKTIQFVKQ